MLKREWGAESNGKLLQLIIPGKTAALVPEFAEEGRTAALVPALAVKDLMIVMMIMMMMSDTSSTFIQEETYDCSNSGAFFYTCHIPHCGVLLERLISA